jgi:hypothetical protein
MRVSRIFTLSTAMFGISAVLPSFAWGNTYNIPAYDNASFSAYGSGWMTTPPANGGHGFQPWSFYQGDHGSYIPYTSAGIGNDPSIGSGPSNKVWSLTADDTANGNVSISAGREFDAPMQINETFFVDMDIQTSDESLTSSTSVALALGSTPTDFSDFSGSIPAFGLLSYGDDYYVVDNNGFLPTNFAVANDPIHITFTLTDLDPVTGDNFTATITSISDPANSESYSGIAGPVQFVQMEYSASSDSVTDTNISANFNRMGITPLPQAAIAAAPLLAILAIGKLKRH